MDMGIIGGADGPTAILLSETTDIFNTMGLIAVILLLLPNIIYAIKYRDAKNKCSNKVMNILEQVGRYACMILMVFCIGMDGFGFGSVGDFLIYLLGNSALLLLYWIVWILFFISQKPWKSMTLAVLPAVIFLLSGITLRHWLLVVFAVIFAVAHIYVTYQNVKEQKNNRKIL